jgi:hypothetical protein
MGYNPERAKAVTGKSVIVGITVLDHDERVVSRTEMHGEIVRVSEAEGIVIQLAGSDETYALPPDTDALKDASPGSYTFRSTGEIVVDPDLMTTWTVRPPPPLQ